MFKPISEWIVKVRKSYVELPFKFNTAEGAYDFYEMLRNAYVEDKNDKDVVSVAIYAEYEDEEEEEGESE